ncbi:MAG: pilus assembly protein [Planctomycetia bacterium]|nr:pilus assembly protein [Planctomycetia bacterium]
MRRPPRRARRPAAAALEFAIVVPLLLLLFLGLMEFSRSMTVLGIASNASRQGARAGAVTPGNYSAVVTAVNDALQPSGLAGLQTTEVRVNNVVVTNDVDFRLRATPGASIAVTVSIPYDRVSWVPGSRYLAGRTLAEGAVMRKEG